MKNIPLTLFVSLLTFLVFGCQPNSSAVAGPEKSYKLIGKEVSFVTPSGPWQETVDTIREEDAELGMSADTVVAVVFRRPKEEGLISVGALGQQRDSENKLIELENDQETLNQIANWVIKRDGKITEQDYIKVLGVNAFRMTFALGDEKRKEKGQQVHFTKDGTHYALSILVPAKDYAAEIPHFDHLLSSFQEK